MRAGIIAAFCVLDRKDNGTLTVADMKHFLDLSVDISFKHFRDHSGSGESGVSMEVHQFVEMCEQLVPLMRSESTENGGADECCHYCIPRSLRVGLCGLRDHTASKTVRTQCQYGGCREVAIFADTGKVRRLGGRGGYCAQFLHNASTGSCAVYCVR